MSFKLPSTKVIPTRESAGQTGIGLNEDGGDAKWSWSTKMFFTSSSVGISNDFCLLVLVETSR